MKRDDISEHLVHFIKGETLTMLSRPCGRYSKRRDYSAAQATSREATDASASPRHRFIILAAH